MMPQQAITASLRTSYIAQNISRECSSQTTQARAGMHPYPNPATQAVTRSMRGNRSTDTKPEVETRRLLHGMGLRFRKSYLIEFENGRTTVDIAFTRLRLVVLIDGCFWHGCPEHGRIPKRNALYWSSKLRGNVQRDKAVNQLLSEAGWTVIRFWSHDSPRQIANAVSNRVGELKLAERKQAIPHLG